MFAALRDRFPRFYAFLARVFTRENLLAVLLALLLILIYITTAADAPIWLYQGF